MMSTFSVHLFGKNNSRLLVALVRFRGQFCQLHQLVPNMGTSKHFILGTRWYHRKILPGTMICVSGPEAFKYWHQRAEQRLSYAFHPKQDYVTPVYL